MNPFLGIGLVLLLLLLLLLGVRWLQCRFQPHAELARKAVHIGMGLICLSFPWLFDALWPVAVLAALALGFLIGIRRLPFLKHSLGTVMGSVKRDSHGEIYFTIAVAMVFYLANGNALLYCVPVLILTLADAVCALIGVRYGICKFSTDDGGQKSLEGSTAFFLIAFAITHVPVLLWGQTGRLESLLIGLAMGAALVLMEAAAWKGIDNLFIPVLSFVLLRTYLPMDATELGLRTLVLIGLTVFVMLWRPTTSLSYGAAAGATFFGYIAWALGGWLWLVPLLVLYLLYSHLAELRDNKDVARDMQAVIRIVAGPLLLLWWSIRWEVPELIYLFYMTLSGHLANICISRLVLNEERSGGYLIVTWSASISCLVLFAPFLFFIAPSWNGVLLTGIACIAAAICGTLFLFSSRTWPRGTTFWREAVLAPATALIGIPFLTLLNL